jgi:tetratricopeptide (TPR) repeat protein
MRYRFVHALYQNVLYAEVPASRGARIAAQVAGSLEEHHGARAGEVASELAVLWETAREAEKAAGYYALAAKHAAEVFAYAESVELADRGLAQIALLPEGPERANLELGLRVSLAFTNVVTRGFSAPQTYEQMARAHELSLEPGRVPQRVPVLWGMVVYHIASGQSERAYGYATQMLEIAGGADDPMLQAMAESAMVGAALFRAELPLAMAAQERAEALAVPEIRAAMRAVVGSDPFILSRCQAARAHWMSGDVARAREIFDRSMADARQSRDPRERAHVALHLVEFETAVGDPAEGARIARDALAVCDEYGVASEQLWTLAYLGGAQQRTGEPHLAVETLRHSMSLLSGIRCLASYAEYQGFLAEALLELGRVEEARAAVNEGFATVEATGEIVWRAELMRIRAAVRTAEGAPAPKVDRLLDEARRTAEATGQRYVVDRIREMR